jgi:ribosome biogenesis GTPase
VAANIDVGAVVVPVVPEPRLAMVERLVAVVWDSGATPLVVLTKADLAPDVDALLDEVAAAAPGVEVVAVSAHTPAGYGPLHAHLTPGRTYCLLGRSGAGKSTLANALLDEQRFATQDIRSDGKGRHTTTFRELVALPGGAVLVDTPGLRGVGLWLDNDGLERAFDDVETLARQCRFGDCAHDTEPGCAVQAAVDDGDLPERRLDSWRKLQREAAWMARRTDARLRAVEARKWKAITLEMRRSGRARP